MKHIKPKSDWDNLRSALNEIRELFYILNDEGYEVIIFKIKRRGFRKGPDIGEEFIYLIWLKPIEDSAWPWRVEQEESRKLLKKSFYKEFYDRVKDICNRKGLKIHLQTIPFNLETGDILTNTHGMDPPCKSAFRILINEK